MTPDRHLGCVVVQALYCCCVSEFRSLDQLGLTSVSQICSSQSPHMPPLLGIPRGMCAVAYR